MDILRVHQLVILLLGAIFFLLVKKKLSSVMSSVESFLKWNSLQEFTTFAFVMGFTGMFIYNIL